MSNNPPQNSRNPPNLDNQMQLAKDSDSLQAQVQNTLQKNPNQSPNAPEQQQNVKLTEEMNQKDLASLNQQNKNHPSRPQSMLQNRPQTRQPKQISPRNQDAVKFPQSGQKNEEEMPGNVRQQDPSQPLRQTQKMSHTNGETKVSSHGKEISVQRQGLEQSETRRDFRKERENEGQFNSRNGEQKEQNRDQEESQNEEDDYSNIRTEKEDDNKSSLSGEGQTRKQESGGRKCFNKLCSSKKFYRKIRSKVEHAKYRFLCKQCYESYCNNDFCEFCEQIYSSTGNTEDDDQWIGCDQCNRWNHIECEKKYRNKNIHEIKDQDSPYLCLTCSCKSKNAGNESKQRLKREFPDDRNPKLKPEINREQRVPIFNRKIENLPSLEYFLQNYNFRLWLNENLIKEDLETLRAAEKRSGLEEAKKNKKVKLD